MQAGIDNAAALPSVKLPAALVNRRLIVVSPHFDDAVLSLGATIAQAVAAGSIVSILTVFGGSPTSTAPAGEWDRKSGFATEAEATLARRKEDDEACRILGALPQRLSFGPEPYERHGSLNDIRDAVLGALVGADGALIPGYPLANVDHAELSRLILQAETPCAIGLYAEQPYAFQRRRSADESMRAAAIESLLGRRPPWIRIGASRAGDRTKKRAIRAYKSQLVQLGLARSRLGLNRMMWYEQRLGGEAIAWLS